MEYTIQSGLLKVTASDTGAELTSVNYRGKEKLWQNPTGAWAGHSPVLFPVCGHCGCKADGKAYPMPPHGLVRKAKFSLKEKSEDSMTFEISSDEETKKAYPFDFVFSVTYQTKENTLFVTYGIENPSETPLWFLCGGHESFNLDGDVDEYKLVFDEEEELVHYPHDGEGFLTGEKVSFGKSKEFPVPANYMLHGETIILGGIRSNGVALHKTTGEKVATLEFKGFSNLLLWRPNGDTRMVCIEPWLNLPDVAGKEDVEFSEKSGAVKVDGGKTKKMERKISYFE